MVDRTGRRALLAGGAAALWAACARAQQRCFDRLECFSVSLAPTNKIRNPGMQNAAAGTPGTLPANWTFNTLAGLSQQVVSVGTDAAGLVYIDVRVFGTTSATQSILRFDTTTGIAAAQGQTRTLQCDCVLAGGTTTNVTSIALTMAERNAAGGNIASVNQTIVPGIIGSSLSANRFTQTWTLPDAATAFILPGIVLTMTNAAAVDITLRIAAPQL